MKSFSRYFSKYYLPRWLVLAFDLTIAAVSWLLSYILRFNFDLSRVEESITPLSLLMIIPILLFCFYHSKSYSGILRHSTLRDIMRIVAAIACTGAILAIISLLGRIIGLPDYFIIPVSVVIIFVLMVSTALSVSRIFAKTLFQSWSRGKRSVKRIMIYGAGQLGQTAYNALLMDSSVSFMLVGYIDNDTLLHNRYVSGVPIYPEEKAFDKIIPKKNVSELIFATDKNKISFKQKQKITDLCLKHGIVVKEVPPIKNWINGELRAQAIQRIRIEDLLGRNSIHFDRQKIAQGLKKSIVLITGAAGSIGSEIVRQLSDFKVEKIILFDKAESDLYNLQQELVRMKCKPSFEVIVGDVTNKKKLARIFKEYTPTIVFNAAAYKHVPLMEEFPGEAIRVNVGGLKNVADLSLEFGVEKFVLISTDKAVNPTNVMGATKRISEIYVQALAHFGTINTQFIITRFGNVLGSNGSVVPLFKNQIENGGPVTVTHKDITRYFMTIPEACQLVLEAGFMGKGGEIFVFDMGHPVRIYDLAKRMISLSGFVVDQDIKIRITGLRPGEKLYEELLSKKETILKHTYNDKIMIGKDKKHDLNRINNQITQLLASIDVQPNKILVAQIKQIVPEFNPMNSEYRNGKPILSALKQKRNRETLMNKSLLNRKKLRSHRKYEYITLKS